MTKVRCTDSGICPTNTKLNTFKKCTIKRLQGKHVCLVQGTGDVPSFLDCHATFFSSNSTPAFYSSAAFWSIQTVALGKFITFPLSPVTSPFFVFYTIICPVWLFSPLMSFIRPPTLHSALSAEFHNWRALSAEFHNCETVHFRHKCWGSVLLILWRILWSGHYSKLHLHDAVDRWSVLYLQFVLGCLDVVSALEDVDAAGKQNRLVTP